MRFFLLSFILLLGISSSSAQTQFLPNPDLENWGDQEVIGITGPTLIYAPDDWFPFGDLFSFLLGQDSDFNMFESFDAQSGLRSVELRPDSSNTYADMVGYFQAGDRPAALHGYYKMDSNPGDTLRIFFSLVDSVVNPPMIPHAMKEVFITQPAPNWTEFEAELDYFDPVNVPDSAIVLIGYTANSYTPGNRVLVDNLWLEYPLSVDDHNIQNLTIYPNPVVESVSISGIEGKGTLEIMDVSGKVIVTQPIASSVRTTVDVSAFPSGHYTVRFLGEKMAVGSFIK